MHPAPAISIRTALTNPDIQELSRPTVDAATVRPQPLAGPASVPSISLRLIATSDIHASLLGYDYCTNRPMPGLGLSQLARQIAAARAEVPNALLFDNGDFLQGNPLADFVATTARRRRSHPVIAAFNALGYDAGTIGNHEFNYGLPFLRATLADARFPVVSANIVTQLGKSPARDTTFVPPFTILSRTVTDSTGRPRRLRIGVIGFAPPQIEVWDRDHLEGRIRVRDILAAARAWLPRMKAQGADVIVALAHSGIGAAEAEDGMENAATALAALPEIDAVIAGHSHLIFPGPGFAASVQVDPVLGRLCGKPAVMPGHSGSHIGIIDLVLTRREADGPRWRVGSSSTRLSPATAAANLSSRLLRQTIGPHHRAALAWSRRVIGSTRMPLHTHFATLGPSAAIALIAASNLDYARNALAGTEWDHLPLLSSAAPFRSGGRGGPDNFTDIPPGPLRMRCLSDLYFYPNTLVTLALTGADIADWLEHSAALFRQITPGSQDGALHDTAVPSFTFDVITGISYRIDLSQPARFSPDGRLVNPAARRITGLSLDSRPVNPDDRFLLATNNHRASRALAQGAATPPQVVLSDGARAQAILRDHIRALGTITDPPPRDWSFSPMPGTTVTISAGPGSAHHLDDIAIFHPEPLGLDATGFAHYRLHL